MAHSFPGRPSQARPGQAQSWGSGPRSYPRARGLLSEPGLTALRPHHLPCPPRSSPSSSQPRSPHSDGKLLSKILESVGCTRSRPTTAGPRARRSRPDLPDSISSRVELGGAASSGSSQAALAPAPLRDGGGLQRAVGPACSQLRRASAAGGLGASRCELMADPHSWPCPASLTLRPGPVIQATRPEFPTQEGRVSGVQGVSRAPLNTSSVRSRSGELKGGGRGAGGESEGRVRRALLAPAEGRPDRGRPGCPGRICTPERCLRLKMQSLRGGISYLLTHLCM